VLGSHEDNSRLAARSAMSRFDIEMLPVGDLIQGAGSPSVFVQVSCDPLLRQRIGSYLDLHGARP
jgi:hypothetical protein